MTGLQSTSLAVVPVLIGPLQVLLAMLPAIVIAVFSTIASLLRPSAVKAMLRLVWRLKLQVALIAVVVIGLWWGLSSVWPATRTRRQDASPAEAGRDWPVFRGNLARTGAVPDSPDPTGGGIRWRYVNGDEAYLSSPAVVGNRVYFTTALIRIGRGRGEIVCLDADTGQPVWTTRPENYDATFSSPVISGDYLVVGEGLHTTTDARIICLSLATGREGEILWSYRTNSHVESTPVIHDGKVYVGAGDKGGFYCFDLHGDGQGNPRLLWRRHGEQYLDAETSIVAQGDRFYAGLGNEGKALVEFDADTGEELRRIEMPYPVFSPPAIVEGKLYAGCGNGDFAKTAEQLGMETGGQLVRVDLESFTIDWSYDLPDTVLGAPAVARGKVYAGCRSGELFVLTTDGKPAGRHETGSEIMTSPAVGERTVYVVSTSGVLQAFDTRTGRAVWERTVGNAPGPNQFGTISSPAIARGHAYVGTQADGFVCVGEPGRPVRPVWSSARGGPRQGAADDLPIPRAVEFLGQFPNDRDGSARAPAVVGCPAIIGKHILVPLTGDSDANGLACLAPAPLGFQQQWAFHTPLGVRAAPVAVGTPEGGLYRAVIVTGREGDANRDLICLDGDGNAVWTRPVAPGASGVLHATTARVHAQVDANTLTALSLTGEPRWTAQTGPLAAPPTAFDSMLLCPVGGETPSLVVLDTPTGRQLLRKPLDAETIFSVATGDQTFLAVTDRGVLAVDPTRPSAKPRVMGPPAATPATSRGRSLWYVSAAGRLVVLDLASGKATPGPAASPVSGPLIVGDRAVFFGEKGEIRTVPADAAQIASSESATLVPGGMNWLGEASTPLLSAGGRVQAAFTGWGLCVFGASQ
jgi:outer membrane protein assembly factor BamB